MKFVSIQNHILSLKGCGQMRWAQNTQKLATVGVCADMQPYAPPHAALHACLTVHRTARNSTDKERPWLVWAT